ncbi:MAG: GPP34 family phosphoprotein [Verrucomicrobiae bacterium]|nr:GPP34 family phosphoprotein [Verrucomicrobiae bacterium]
MHNPESADFPELSIPEELLLLSLDDEEGKLVSSDSTVLRFTLSGGILDELVIRGLVKIEDRKVVDWPREPIGDPILDPAIERLVHKDKVKKLSYWIQHLSKDYRHIKDILLNKLVKLGALKKEEHHFLWAFAFNRYPTNDVRIENRIRRRVRASLFSDEPVDPRDAVLLSLIHAGKLEVDVFGDLEAPEARARIISLKKRYGIGSAVSHAILDFEFSL